MMPKFRAWDKEHEEMLYPDDEDKIFFEVTVYGMNTLDMRVDPDEYGGFSYLNTVIMQSTGLRDKNGVEIFEGDILKLRDSYLAVYVVEWHRNKFMWVLRYQKDKNQYFPFYAITNTFLEDLELLGNVYQTPELFGGVE